MPRKRRKIKTKKAAAAEGWKLEFLQNGWFEWWKNPGGCLSKSEIWERCAFVHLKKKQLEAWRTIRSKVDISDYPYAAKYLEVEI